MVSGGDQFGCKSKENEENKKKANAEKGPNRKTNFGDADGNTVVMCSSATNLQ